MLELYYKYPRVLRRLRSGGLGDEMDRIAAYLFEHGYKHGSAKIYLSRLSRFSSDVARTARAKPIDQATIDRFVEEFPTDSPGISARTAIELARRVVPERFLTACVEPDPHRLFLDDYLDHLRRVRGLEPKTCEGLLLIARRILIWRDAHFSAQSLAAMTGEDVLALVEHLLTLSVADSTRASTTSHVRVFLQYLRWSGFSSQDLARFVPRVPCYRLAHLPPRLAWEDVRHAIDAVDASTPVGVRNRAPVRPIDGSTIISKMVRAALERCGIELPRVAGAHLVRHSLATQLVRQRRPINEVADLLGHRSIDTTAIYVKVAVPQLADVALPFPGGTR